MFVIAEIVAILCLNEGYKESSEVEGTEFQNEIKSIQDSADKYFAMKSAHSSHSKFSQEETTLEQITNKLQRDEVLVRNPGHPEHHLMFSAELFKPLDKELAGFFGFTVDQGVLIRSKFSNFLNDRFFKEIDIAKVKAIALKDEVIRFRNTNLLMKILNLQKSNSLNSNTNLQKKCLA